MSGENFKGPQLQNFYGKCRRGPEGPPPVWIGFIEYHLNARFTKFFEKKFHENTIKLIFWD